MSNHARKTTSPAKALNKALAETSRREKNKRKSQVALDAARDASRRNDLSPELQFVTRPIASLHAPKVNARTIDPEHVAETARSIAKFGISKPVLITTDDEIIDGVITVEAAHVLGITEIKCVVVEHLSRMEVKRLRLALNRLGEKGTYDSHAFKLVLEELCLEDEILDIPGFEPEELDLILTLEPEANAATEDEFNAPDPTALPIAKIGDLFLLNGHRLFCGDACDPASYPRLFEDATLARIMATDMPYGCKINGHVSGKGKIKHREFVDGTSNLSDAELETLATKCFSASSTYLVPGALIFAFMDYHGIETLLRAGRNFTLQLLNLLVWNKGRGGMGGLYRNAHELIALFKLGSEAHLDRVKLGAHGRDRTNVLTYPGATTRGSSAQKALDIHPTPKSVELLADLMLDTTERDDVVLDPFAGSGTIFIAAEKIGRIAFGIELDPLYVDAIIKRYESHTKKLVIHAGSGMSFSALSAHRATETPAQKSCTNEEGADVTLSSTSEEPPDTVEKPGAS